MLANIDFAFGLDSLFILLLYGNTNNHVCTDILSVTVIRDA